MLFNTASRLRSAERLIASLQRKDAVEAANERGFNFPSSTGEQLDALLKDLARTMEEEEGHEEKGVKEELLQEWDKQYGKTQEDSIYFASI